MSRNSSGTYTLPAGQPAVTGTTISAPIHNTLASDLAAEITDSLSRSGKGGMTAPFRVVDGTAAAPSLSFTSETGSGLYRAGASDVGISVAGTRRLRIQPTGVTVPNDLTVTGAETVGSTLGVTGAITGASIGVTGAATVGTTLGVTGAATLSSTLGVTGNTTMTGNLEVQGSTGITLTAGDVAFTEAAAQTILKTSQRLTVGTTDNNGLYLRTNGTDRFWITGPGDLTSNGTAKITALPTPTADSDAATKAYVDSVVPVSATAGTALSASTWTTIGSSPMQVPANGAMTFECLFTGLPGASGTVGSGINIRIQYGSAIRICELSGETIRSTGATTGARTAIASQTATNTSANEITGQMLDFTGPPRFYARIKGTVYNGSSAQTINFQAYRDSATALSVSARCLWETMTP